MAPMILASSARHGDFGVLLSQVLGVSYVFFWSVLYWPQIILNCRRKSTTGMSTMFVTLNVIGFASYLSYCLSRTYVQEKYDLPKAVTAHDILFATHALCCSSIQLTQVWVYRDKNVVQLFTRSEQSILRVLLAAIALAFLLALEGFLPWYYVEEPPAPVHVLLHRWTSNGTDEIAEFDLAPMEKLDDTIAALPGSNWTVMGRVANDTALRQETSPWARLWTFTQVLGSVKVFVTLIKYPAQLTLNIRRRSTKGMAPQTYIFDCLGASSSMMQNIVIAVELQDPGYIMGNLPKLLIGAISFTFALSILAQHYLLYGEGSHAEHDVEYDRVTKPTEKSRRRKRRGKGEVELARLRGGSDDDQ